MRVGVGGGLAKAMKKERKGEEKERGGEDKGMTSNNKDFWRNPEVDLKLKVFSCWKNKAQNVRKERKEERERDVNRFKLLL